MYRGFDVDTIKSLKKTTNSVFFDGLHNRGVEWSGVLLKIFFASECCSPLEVLFDFLHTLGSGLITRYETGEEIDLRDQQHNGYGYDQASCEEAH